MNWSLSWLITPSRSSTISFSGRCGCDSVVSWTMAARSARELRDVGDPVHQQAEPVEQREAVGADAGVLRVDEHLVEERVDRAAQRGERLQRFGVAAGGQRLLDPGLDIGQRGG